ncbi:class I SAM-dependent methyltransferase [Patescibacteria group bacterium]|nr:class I SAM-dependent methyltransferase [Patescibacteria group bacterium]MBU2220185.1 class I SAM-dependent methyltransferase [Patescibacteria group bacterium]MBU2265285.1 class I SAM-dependent methyltransferase [Patescibacteria group bacterium]
MDNGEEKLLKYVISLCKEKKNALDLGCGNGGHSIFLAQKGFLVDSVDSSPKALEALEKRIKEKAVSRITVISANIAQFAVDKKYDLIMAASSLHFFQLQTIRDILARIKNWLTDDGILFLRIFSNKDDEFIKYIKEGRQSAPNEIISPRTPKSIHYFSQDEVKELVRGFEIIKLEEVKKFADHQPDGPHWHWMFEVVVKKTEVKLL